MYSYLSGTIYRLCISRWSKLIIFIGVSVGVVFHLIERQITEKLKIEIIRDTINPDLPLGIGARPKMSEKTFSSCVNINELTKDTGFVPEIYFEEGINKTIEWFKKNH